MVIQIQGTQRLIGGPDGGSAHRAGDKVLETNHRGGTGMVQQVVRPVHLGETSHGDQKLGMSGENCATARQRLKAELLSGQLKEAHKKLH